MEASRAKSFPYKISLPRFTDAASSCRRPEATRSFQWPPDASTNRPVECLRPRCLAARRGLRGDYACRAQPSDEMAPYPVKTVGLETKQRGLPKGSVA